MRKGWYKKWRENGWLNHLKEPVANRDLWERLLEATQRHQEEPLAQGGSWIIPFGFGRFPDRGRRAEQLGRNGNALLNHRPKSFMQLLLLACAEIGNQPNDGNWTTENDKQNRDDFGGAT